LVLGNVKRPQRDMEKKTRMSVKKKKMGAGDV